jgi:hypothetical protein
MPTDPSSLEWREEKVLIIGRASPEPSKKHIETVCTGGITEQGELLRLYPIPLRYLDSNSRYKLWTWAKFDIQKNASDRRKESYKVRDGSIKILAQVTNPSERFALLKKAIFPDKETLNDLYHKDWTSVGVIEIEFVDFYVKPREKTWESAKPYVRQSLLYEKRKPLEQLPFEMRLKFKCRNNPTCKLHDCSLIGWQYMEAFRNFTARYGSPENGSDILDNKIRGMFSEAGKSSFALLGTHSRYGSWMVAELYFIEKNVPERLFL